jgi:hypothetical protein
MTKLSQETEALAKRLAAAQSLSVEDAIRQALEARACLRFAGAAQTARSILRRHCRTTGEPKSDRRGNRCCRSSIRALHAKSWTILTPYDCFDSWDLIAILFDDERALAVQGRRLRGNRRPGMSLN